MYHETSAHAIRLDMSDMEKVVSAVLYNLVIVKARVPGIYGSKLTESEGVARGQGQFTLTQIPGNPCYKCYISYLIGP